jgi:hypothetical protein
MRIWTEEQRRKQSDIMKSLWTDPEGRKYHGLKLRRQPNCLDCGESNIENFYKDSHGRRTNARCKKCHKQRCKERWHTKTQEEKQASRVHSMYGVTPENYLELHKTQNGKCALCDQEPATKRGLHLDHCHATGKIRGLLCHSCNTGLGSFRDNPELLNKAIQYLRS